MKTECFCESRPAEMCCPADSKLRKEWLSKLEKEHKYLRDPSKEIAGRLRILSNPSRVEILLMLSLREHCMDEIAKKLKARKSAISYHLELLKKHGMICVKNRSRFAFYSLSDKGKNTIETFGDI